MPHQGGMGGACFSLPVLCFSLTDFIFLLLSKYEQGSGGTEEIARYADMLSAMGTEPRLRIISALLPGRPAHSSAGAAPAVDTAPVPAPPAPAASPSVLPIDLIEPNPVQPRVAFQADRLDELANSIRSNGIIQPIIVRNHNNRFEIVAGERRWRAAKLAGLSEVPVVVQDVADRQMLELALIENIQREDLNPIETAYAYERLGRELGLSQEEIGRRTGKDRTSIANTLRLLKLPREVQLLLAEHRLSMGHARAILAFQKRTSKFSSPRRPRLKECPYVRWRLWCRSRRRIVERQCAA